MPPRPSNVAELLVIARDLVAGSEFDSRAAMATCGALLGDDPDEQLLDAITHARLVAESALNGTTAHVTVARFALARVVVLLEKQVEPRLVGRS